MTTSPSLRFDYLEVAQEYAADAALWRLTPKFTAGPPWHGRIASDVDYEVWLYTWLPGQGTDLHDHGPSAGAVAVASGTLVENALNGGVLTLTPGEGRRFSARHLHRFHNPGTENAVSVHVFGPALQLTTHYRIEHNRHLVTVAVDRAGVQW
jgi:hypothetical protein